MLPNHLNWIPVDPENLPDGEVLALGETKEFRYGLLYLYDGDVKCEFGIVTHYIPLDEIPMPGEDKENKTGIDLTTPSLNELKARAQDVADRFNKKYGLETMVATKKVLGLTVMSTAEVIVEEHAHTGIEEVYVRIETVGGNGCRAYSYIYCADADRFTDRFQGCLDD